MHEFLSEVLYTPLEFAAMAAFVAVGCLIQSLLIFRRARVTRSWRPVDATITWSQVDEREVRQWFGTHTQYRPDIRYSYQIGTTPYEGTRIYHGAHDWWSRSKLARELVHQYPPGARVKVYVDPARSGESILEQGQTKAARGLMTASIVSALLSLGLAAYGRTHPTF